MNRKTQTTIRCYGKPKSILKIKEDNVNIFRMHRGEKKHSEKNSNSSTTKLVRELKINRRNLMTETRQSLCRYQFFVNMRLYFFLSFKSVFIKKCCFLEWPGRAMVYIGKYEFQTTLSLAWFHRTDDDSHYMFVSFFVPF